MFKSSSSQPKRDPKTDNSQKINPSPALPEIWDITLRFGVKVGNTQAEGEGQGVTVCVACVTSARGIRPHNSRQIRGFRWLSSRSMCSMSQLRCETCVAMMGLVTIGSLGLSVEVGNAISIKVCVEMAVIKSGSRKPPTYRCSFIRVTITPPSIIRVGC